MKHFKLVAGTESPTRYTKIIRNPGADTKYNRTYQETDFISRYTKTAAPGIGYTPPAIPEPEPEPEPEPQPETSIGSLSLTVDDVSHTYGDVIHCVVNQSLRFHMSTGGDADPSFKWEARGSYPMMISEQAASTILTFPEFGNVTLTCTITDYNATDSPITYAMSVYVASEEEWELIHPNK